MRRDEGERAADDDARRMMGNAGVVGAVMAGRDWSGAAVGPPSTWSPALRQVVAILLSSRFSMWMGWGPDLAFFYNDSYQRDTLRAKHPWALGRPAREVWAEIWDDIGPRIASVLQTGQATWDEGLLLFLERSGYVEETYHTFSYSPLRAGDGEIAGFLCVVSEDTERVLGERRLRVLSELGEITAATAATPEQACAAALEVLGQHRLDLPFASIHLLDDTDTLLLRAASYGLAGDTAVVPEIVTRHDDPGSPVWPALSSREPQMVAGPVVTGAVPAPLPEPMPGRVPESAVVLPLGGGARSAGVLVAGISPFRAFDEDYRRFVELVAGQVGNAISAAAAFQAQSRRAEELAELDRAKTAFFTGVSHELRTPLTLIAGPAEDGLADERDPLLGAQRARMEIIARNSGRLRRLVDTMLEFSRLEAGRAVPQRASVDLAALTASLAESFGPAIQRADLDYQIDCPPLASAVSVDVDMWEKIVLNLLSNAVKYTLAGHIRLTLHGTADGVRLVVVDTGIGIPAEDLPRLFERFHRVRGAAGRSHEGSGIGLALVEELAALHGGSVAVDSVLGTGSTFTVTLPSSAFTVDAPVAAGTSGAVALYREEALQWSSRPGDQPTADPVDPRPPGPVGPGGGARVLVVDDNRDLRQFLAQLLAPHYQVATAVDGAAALDAIGKQRPDLVLTDVMMPGLDGFGLIKALRANPATATIPVIMLSARAGEEASIEGLAAGADDYLVKPFSSHDLLARVQSNLALARLRNHEGAWRTALLNALQDGLYVMDPSGAVIEINQSFTDILGYGPEGLPYPAPHPWWPDALRHPDDHAQILAAQAEIQAAGSGRYVFALHHRDGHRLWASCSASTIADPEAPGPVVVGVVRDVTAEHRAATRERLLTETTELLAAPGELTARLHAVVARAAPALADLAVVSLTTPDGLLRPHVAAHRHHLDDPEQILGLPAHRIPATLADAYGSGAAFVVDPLTDDLLAQAAPGAPDLGQRTAVDARTALVVPLTAGGRLLGSLALVSIGRSRTHDRFDVQTAGELGRRVAAAIEADRIADREHHLHAITAALASADTVAAVAAVLATHMATVLTAAGVTVHVPDPDDASHLRLAHQTGDSPTYATVAFLGLDAHHPIAQAARDRAPLWLGTVEDRAARFPNLPTTSGGAVMATAVVPMMTGATVAGVLMMGFTGPRAFAPDERSFVAALAGQAALALDRAAIADARAEIATTLQLGLLPARLPALAGVALAARYLPAGQYTSAGGDWYDVTVLDDDHLALTVGDVVGHGSHAAAVMGQLRAALSAFLSEGHSPARALTLLSGFAAGVDGARGSTAICVVLQISSHAIRWARAGHLPPIICEPGRAPRLLDDAHGTVLGLRGAPPVTEDTEQLTPGTSILLYTDGLVERRGEDIDDGLARLTATLAEQPRRPVSELVDILVDSAIGGSGPPDDVAVLLARLRPSALEQERPAQPPMLAEVRREIRRWAATADLPPEQLDDLQLALGEALTNTVEHAYPTERTEPGSMRYRVAMRADGGVEVQTGDDGTWRTPPADPGTRGHGLRTIRALTDDLHLDHDHDGTQLRFVVLAPARPAPPPALPPAPAVPDGPATRLEIHHEDGRLVLQVQGELDVVAVDGIRGSLLDTAAAASGEVVIDLCAVTHLASAGVALIADTVAAGAGKVRLRVTDAGATATVLRLAGLLEPR